MKRRRGKLGEYSPTLQKGSHIHLPRKSDRFPRGRGRRLEKKKKNGGGGERLVPPIRI